MGGGCGTAQSIERRLSRFRLSARPQKTGILQRRCPEMGVDGLILWNYRHDLHDEKPKQKRAA